MRKTKILLTMAIACMAVSMSAQTYEWVSRNSTFTDGTLLYTLNSFTYTNGVTKSLASDEVAVQLYMNETVLSNDTIRRLSTYPGAWPTDASDRSILENLSEGESYTFTSGDWSGVTYTYIGSYATSNGGTKFKTYKRENYPLTGSLATSVTIPSTVTFDGKTYKVVAIPYGGFIYAKSSNIKREYCNSGTTVDETCYVVYQGGNDYLETVNFAEGCNIKYIGSWAFAGCTKLSSFTLPNSVEEFGTYSSGSISNMNCSFEGCKSLKSFTFQDGTQVKMIPAYFFYGCHSLTSLEVPSSIESIEDWALTYNNSLSRILLSEGLKEIGIHFLCGASSLVELTFPASLTTIRGSILHGCENIKSVTLLGAPSDFTADDTNSSPFEYNHYYCKDNVNNCTFYVPEDYQQQYREHDLWRLIFDNDYVTGEAVEDGNIVRDKDGQTHISHGNTVTKIPGRERDFKAGQWYSVVFPNGVDDIASTFGEGTVWAVMTASSEGVWNEETRHWTYSLTFTQQSGNSIEKGVVGMLKPAKTVSKTMWLTSQETDADFRSEMSIDHSKTVTASDGAVITMSSRYVDYYPYQYQFYFKSFAEKDEYGNYGEFRHVRTNNEDLKIKVGATRAYWSLKIDGVRVDATGSRVSSLPEGITGIEGLENNADVVIDGVYDLSGRKIAITPEELSEGMYIINGKKFILK